jgi:hypothetical protein
MTTDPFILLYAFRHAITQSGTPVDDVAVRIIEQAETLPLHVRTKIAHEIDVVIAGGRFPSSGDAAQWAAVRAALGASR